MENALRACCKGIKIGKILIHREGDNGQNVSCTELPISFSLALASSFSSINYPLNILGTTADL